MLHVGFGMTRYEKGGSAVVVGLTVSRAKSKVATVDFVFECGDSVE